jgi:hypothetical protein
MSLTPVECQEDAHPLLLRDHQLQSEVVVYGDLDILFGAEITLGGLECQSRNLICSRSPLFFRQSLAKVRRRVVGAEDSAQIITLHYAPS